MNVWYDTEFHERGPNHPIELISIGMVREDGAELYRVNSDMDFDAAWANEWLRENVVKQLPLLPHENYTRLPQLDINNPEVCPRAGIRRDVSEFLQVPHLHLWAWFAAYDHVVLAQLFGTMVQLPPHIPMFTHDLKQEVERLHIGQLPKQQDGEHNALSDALFLGARAIYVREWARNRGLETNA